MIFAVMSNREVWKFRPGARFSKVLKLFGRISGPRGKKLCSYFEFLFSLQQMKKKTALQSRHVGVLQMAILTRKVFGTCEKRAPERDSNPELCNVVAVLLNFYHCLSNTDTCEDHLH